MCFVRQSKDMNIVGALGTSGPAMSKVTLLTLTTSPRIPEILGLSLTVPVGSSLRSPNSRDPMPVSHGAGRLYSLLEFLGTIVSWFSPRSRILVLKLKLSKVSS